MKAGDEDLNYSVRPIEVDNIDGDGELNGDVALKIEGEDGDSEGEDLRLETGEACERVKLDEEGAVIKKLVDPKLPSQEAVDRHWIRGHVEYRNWCGVCVKARGKEWDHTKVGEKERLMPEYSVDYCCLLYTSDAADE